MHGGIYTSHRDARLEATVNDPARPSKYRWRTSGGSHVRVLGRGNRRVRETCRGPGIARLGGALRAERVIVRGRTIGVTAVAFTYQCAEMARTARGFGAVWPKVRHAAVYRFCSSAFIGLPCPKKTAGIGLVAL